MPDANGPSSCSTPRRSAQWEEIDGSALESTAMGNRGGRTEGVRGLGLCEGDDGRTCRFLIVLSVDKLNPR
ncbi:MAG: hypothetical protein C0482_21315 [Gordonia sp.]|nr:hypothetical protein [Gordonia sp. (in: high G+C Gram-positive bacteria)]